MKLRFISSYQVNKSPLLFGFDKPDYTIYLRFKRNFKRNVSPLSFGFYEPNYAIEMRFSDAFNASYSPLKLRFDGNTDPVEPPEPTLPYLQPNIGMVSEQLWETTELNSFSSDISWHGNAMGSENDIAFIDSAIEVDELDISWQGSSRETTENTLDWGSSGNVSDSFSLSYKTSLHLSFKKISMLWSNLEKVNYTEFRIDYSFQIDLSNFMAFYWEASPDLVTSEIVISYGESAAEYICYWKNHPFKGYVIGEFLEPTPEQSGRLIMRFKNPDKVCYWGVPGGLIRGDDDVPTIDQKIPIEPQLRNTYFMNNTIDCERVSDGQKILISGFNYQLSRSQFTSTCSLTFCSRIDFERAIDELVKVTINGYVFYMHVETPNKSLKFNAKSYTASGRGRLSELSAPFVSTKNYTNSTAKTLAGLMSDIVLNTGWIIDNQMIDFSVPALAFSYQNKTASEALLMCANSVGGMLSVDEYSKVISLVPKWPVMPWDTEDAICDVIINDSVILDYSETRVISPACDAVFVRGEQVGVSCKVKRTGTSGNNFANDVVDQLITHVQAARQRGSYELAETGNKQQVSIRTKVMNDLPPMKPGMLIGIRYSDSIYKATCDSVSISANVSSEGLVSVNQTFTVLKNE